MYFDNYQGDHQGRLIFAGYKPNYVNLYMLKVEFDDGYNSNSSTYSNELVIQGDRPLGRRLSLMHLENHVNEILQITRDGDLFKFYAEDTYIGLIGPTDEWTKVEDDEWFDNLKYKFNYERQAKFFGRTVDEIQKRDEEKFYHEGLVHSLTSTKKGSLSDIKGVPKSILKYGVSIGPAIKDKDGEYFGEVFYGDSESERIVSAEETLFGFTPEEVEALTKQLQGDIITIKSINDADIFKHPFFIKDKKESDLYAWLKLEDLHEGSFSSYSFAFGQNLNDLKSFVNTNEADFLRHIMFLRSKQTESLDSINKEEQKNTRFQAVRSAIAVIMSRNMSHNLGSHVLYYTQKDLIEKSNEYDDDLDKMMKSYSSSDKTELSNKLVKQRFLPYSSSLRGSSFIVSLLKNRTNFVAAIAEDVKFPALPVSFESEIWDFFDIDKNPNAKPTINYYLKNLVRSEGFTRGKALRKGELRIRLDSSSIDSQKLHHLNLSLPGGTISIQAICNIFENFIRNSAKYWAGKYVKRLFNLEFTIKVSVVDDNLCIIIYDNKGDAQEILTDLQGKLHGLKILNDDGSLNKDDKGLKEMIMSYLWLRSGAFEESMSEFIYQLDSGIPEKRKRVIDFIESTFSYCDIKKNLGLKFYLPIHHVWKPINNELFESLPRNNEGTPSFNQIHADVVSADEKLINDEVLTQIFPRITSLDAPVEQWTLAKDSVNENNDEKYREVKEMYRAICLRFNAEIDENKLYFERSDANLLPILEARLKDITKKPEKQVYYSTHLSAKRFTAKQIKEYYNDFLYADSISGGNYTKVLEQLLEPSFVDYLHMNTWENKLLSLKIKESAITRITVIDERLFGGVKHWLNVTKLPDNNEDTYSIKDSQLELSLRNIRVLNWIDNKGVHNSPEFSIVKELPLFCGNEFRNVGPYSTRPQKTNFLTIHLGLIEEMLKSENTLINDICGASDGNPLSNERISKLMERIKKVFEPDYICIHSGRGGLSEEAEKTILNKYPFLPFSTLESVFNDSKFLLSQMFYSMKYKRTL